MDIGHRAGDGPPRHRVARTRSEAVRLALETKPDLVLADIQLADNSSGIDAVNDILQEFQDLPVIFITPSRAAPDRHPARARLPDHQALLRGAGRSAVSQAMFFASTETLAA
jgi:CheY-like chemotaxis protein